MAALGRRIGIGLAARGDVEDVVRWAGDARRGGLDSVWIHDSYFERDAVSYVSAISSALGPDERDDGFRIALGAVNPFTRHPVVLAMTGSALDEMAPGRIVMGLGTGLPLRLKQMGVPYSPDGAVEGVSRAMDEIRALWAGERVPSATPGLPPIQPMFAPPHRIPLFIAAYRKEFVALAGQKADGYLARPAESVPSLKGIVGRLRAAATEAGRDPRAIESAGYLLTLVDDTRREALNRAKREPFVIYMMSVLGDVSLARAGFDRDLRDRIAAAWRAEDFHTAGKLIPDELLDAFMLCGTREDVAAGALRFNAEADLELPLLQPVLQEDDQVDELLAAARLYAALPGPREATAPDAAHPVEMTTTSALPVTAGPVATTTLADDRALGLGSRMRRRVGTVWEIVRPFAYTASIIPVAAGGALAWADGRFDLGAFLLALVGGVALHSGTNIINEIFDVRQGIDTITSPRASHAILKGRVTERGAYLLAIGLLRDRGAGGARPDLAARLADRRPRAARSRRRLLLYRTAVPVQVPCARDPARVPAHGAADDGRRLLRDRAAPGRSRRCGSPSRSACWSRPSSTATSGATSARTRGRGSARCRRGSAGNSPTTRTWCMTLGAYMTLALAVVVEVLPAQVMLAALSLPLLAVVIRSAELGAGGQARAIAMIDLQTARLHMAFGALLVAGVLLSGTVWYR